jgi:hypothetical protein
MGDAADEMGPRGVARRLGLALLIALPLTAMALMAVMVGVALLADVLIAVLDVDSDLADQDLVAAAMRPALIVTAASAAWLVLVGLATLTRRRP